MGYSKAILESHTQNELIHNRKLLGQLIFHAVRARFDGVKSKRIIIEEKKKLKRAERSSKNNGGHKKLSNLWVAWHYYYYYYRGERQVRVYSMVQREIGENKAHSIERVDRAVRSINKKVFESTSAAESTTGPRAI